MKNEKQIANAGFKRIANFIKSNPHKVFSTPVAIGVEEHYKVNT
tara:strand:- start:534 stop:665 length:132 start_codon:yes stop_codon:yes gene_type:complete